jgi:hypothetical protein
MYATWEEKNRRRKIPWGWVAFAIGVGLMLWSAWINLGPIHE